jgi:hypothetical protein
MDSKYIYFTIKTMTDTIIEEINLKLFTDDGELVIYDMKIKLMRTYNGLKEPFYHLSLHIEEDGYRPRIKDYFFRNITEIDTSYGEDENKFSVCFDTNKEFKFASFSNEDMDKFRDFIIKNIMLG